MCKVGRYSAVAHRFGATPPTSRTSVAQSVLVKIHKYLLSMVFLNLAHILLYTG
jgi:hypothetical protein